MSYLKYDGTAAVLTSAPTKNYYGTSAVETLTGTSAHEAFFLGTGDTAVGGGGDDTYYLQGHGTAVVEQAGGGVDKIVAWANVNLARHPHVEHLAANGDKTYGAGNALDNVISGGPGAQQLYGGLGQDVLIGGAGADIFIVVKGEGNDVIQDFNPAEDKLRLKAGLTSFEQVKARMVQVGDDVKLDLGDGHGLMFRSITVGQFRPENFQLELDMGRLGARTFADEFSGPLSIWDKESNPSGTWRPDFGYQGSQGYGSYTLAANNELQIYTSPYFRDHPGDFAESPFASNPDGTLSIWARPSTNPEIFGYGYTSGMISSRPSFSQTYGYFEMRADLPAAKGAWPAFWLLPTDWSWPPELDVMEALTHDPDSVWTTQHSKAGGGHIANGQLSFVPDTADGFHTYGALWGPEEIVWYVDGVEVFRTPTPADMHKPMFMIANLALGGWGGAVDNSHLPAELKIDYIRAYALGPSAPPEPPPPEPPPAPTPDPTPTGVTLTASAPGEVLIGGAGDDTLVAGKGPVTLTGGAGADHFVFNVLPSRPALITDFESVDVLDLRALFDAIGYRGSNPVADGYLRFDKGAGGTKVMFDPDGDGRGKAFHVATLEGVSPKTVAADDWIFQ